MLRPDRPLSSQRFSQFNLRTLFVLIACSAMGLAIGTAKPVDMDNANVAEGYHYPIFGWREGVLATGAALMVVGLLSQAIFLRQTSRDIEKPDLGLAWKYAFWWRMLLAIVMSSCLFVQLLSSRQVFALPENNLFIIGFYDTIFPNLVLRLSVVAVLLVGVNRWRTNQPAVVQGIWSITLHWALAIALSSLVLCDKAIIHYFAHLAIAGIELGTQMRFQRMDSFLRSSADENWFFVISITGLASFFLGTALALTRFNRTRAATSIKHSILTFVTSLLLLVATSYCAWYYTVGLAYVSPEFASVGIDINWSDIAGAIFLIGILSTALAHSLGSRYGKEEDRTEVCVDIPVGWHESLLVGCLFAGVMLENVFEFFRSFIDPEPWLAGYSKLIHIELLLSLCTHDLFLVILVLSIQLSVSRWKKRGQSVPLKIVRLKGSTFVRAWGLALAIALIGIPMISAFSFSFWLGPWYRW